MLSLTSQVEMGSVIKVYTDERYNDINMTEHLDTWAKNKSHIFKLFGNKLKIEKEVETQLPYTIVQDKLFKFIEEELSASKFNLIKVFLRTLAIDEVGSNVLERDFTMFDTVFKKGIKVSKCFRHLVKKAWLDESNTKYSMFLQSLIAKGTAVLSIDPIDYLTMSANSSGWRSCHAPDGEYRVGQIAYMMDQSSVISYVKSSEDCTLQDGTCHANKIWRQIVLVNNNNTVAMQLRQYPANNDANAITVGGLLQAAIEKWTGNDYARHEGQVGSNAFDRLQKDFDGCTNTYYNDVENTSFETGHMIIPNGQDKETFFETVGGEAFPTIIVGAAVPCLDGCGNWLEDGEHYFCENNGYDYDNSYDNSYDNNNYDD